MTQGQETVEVVQADREAFPFVLLYSGEHHAYWRPNSAGYCTDGLGAGIYDRGEAERIVAGNDPEKRITIREIDPSWPIIAALTSTQPVGEVDTLREALAEIRLAHDALNVVTTNRRKYGAVATQTLTAGHALASAEARLSALIAALSSRPAESERVGGEASDDPALAQSPLGGV